jgi:hypothetical protein
MEENQFQYQIMIIIRDLKLNIPNEAINEKNMLKSMLQKAYYS